MESYTDGTTFTEPGGKKLPDAGKEPVNQTIPGRGNRGRKNGGKTPDGSLGGEKSLDAIVDPFGNSNASRNVDNDASSGNSGSDSGSGSSGSGSNSDSNSSGGYQDDQTDSGSGFTNDDENYTDNGQGGYDDDGGSDSNASATAATTPTPTIPVVAGRAVGAATIPAVRTTPAPTMVVASRRPPVSIFRRTIPPPTPRNLTDSSRLPASPGTMRTTVAVTVPTTVVPTTVGPTTVVPTTAGPTTAGPMTAPCPIAVQLVCSDDGSDAPSDNSGVGFTPSETIGVPSPRILPPRRPSVAQCETGCSAVETGITARPRTMTPAAAGREMKSTAASNPRKEIWTKEDMVGNPGADRVAAPKASIEDRPMIGPNQNQIMPAPDADVPQQGSNRAAPIVNQTDTLGDDGSGQHQPGGSGGGSAASSGNQGQSGSSNGTSQSAGRPTTKAGSK